MMITSSYLTICHSCGCLQSSIYCLPNLKMPLILQSLDFYRIFTVTTMDAADYWAMAQEYSICNAAIASWQFWTEDLDLVTLGIATEHVYTTFFYTSTSHTLCQQSDETLFGHFVIALNTTFTQQLSLADDGYKSGSDTIDLPTPLRKTSHIHHVASLEHTSLNPVTTTSQTPPRPVCRCLSFSSADNYTPDSTPVCSDSSDEEEEDFQTVPLDDEDWTSEETPERTFCIHKHGLPHNLCQYPCPYENHNTVSYMDSLDLVTFQFMRITWLPPVMKKYQEWKKYHTNIELWFAWTFVLTYYLIIMCLCELSLKDQSWMLVLT